jgi:GT2 family glycosyltransferase
VEPESQHAPPVVAVVVVHDPGDWFDTTLQALAAQDYPNLRTLVLVADDAAAAVPGHGESSGASAAEATVDPDLERRITERLPRSFVRALGSNPGFGVAVNEVLRLVEGDNGMFLVCHDDVAPEPDALRLMVEELYRSNAGAVGPKLVDWDEPAVLQSVGLGMDRFGEIDAVVEPGEVDQEQHDGVRDVFVVPSAFLLLRADLFRTLGGFDPAIDYHGEDIELCWRIHHSGARVVVAPAARVRHLGRLEERRPDLPHERIRARHRMRSVATLTGASRLPGRSVEMVLLTLVELIVGLFTGRFGEAWASLRALGGLVPRTPVLLARRREVAPHRHVPEREVYSLQERGSTRLNSYLRSRDTATYVGQHAQIRRWRESTTAPVFAWLAVLAGVIIGGRSFLGGGVPAVGEFLAFPDSPRQLLETFVSGWNPTGAGATSPNPTGWATLSLLSVLTLFNMALLQTLFVLGLVVIGAAGAWKLASVFPSTRAQVAVLVVYAASPLVPGAMSSGRLTVLVVYAAIPWFVHLTCRATGLATADPTAAEIDVPDGVVDLDLLERARRTVLSGLVLAAAAAFAPVVLPVAVLLAVVLALGTLLAQASWRTAAWLAATGAGATAVAALLNLPWIVALSWEGVVGARPLGEAGLGLWAVASFEIGRVDLAALALALYLPVLAAMALARAWRLTWAVRAGAIVSVFGALAVLGDRGALAVSAPQAGVLLVPVALAVAVGAGSALAAFDLDIRGASFGWKQPLGLLAGLAVIMGVVPGVLALADGSFKTPSTPLARLIDASLPAAAESGDYNVLFLGDARVLPVPASNYRDGVSWAIVDDDDLDTRDRWPAPPNAAADLVTTALDEMAASTTLRAGRLLAPLGIRYIVVPEFDGVVSTVSDPLPLPIGLIGSLEDQLDLVAREPRLPTIQVFENRAWLPTSVLLQGAAAEATTAAGAEVLVRTEFGERRPVFIGWDQFGTFTDQLTPGVVHLGVPSDENWSLTVDGERIAPRRAFGQTTAFDVATPGTGALRYETSVVRVLLVLLQTALWIGALVLVSRVRLPAARRRGVMVSDEPLIDLTAEPTDALPGVAEQAVP